jgi:hypothetical protein
MILLTVAYLYKKFGHKFPFNKLGAFVKTPALQPVVNRVIPVNAALAGRK